jgi:hypothetical protein
LGLPGKTAMAFITTPLRTSRPLAGAGRLL